MKAARALLLRHRRQSADERRKDQVTSRGVKQSIYLGYINNELTSEAACLELPMTIVILLCFSLCALSALQQNKVYTVENAMEFDITENANFAWAHNFGHKGINDVNSIADFWSWLRLGYLPLIVQGSWGYSEDYPPALGDPAYAGTRYGRPTGKSNWLFDGYDKPSPIRNDYLRHQRLVGAIKLHQTVSPMGREHCTLPLGIDKELMEKWLAKPCTYSDAGELTPERRDVDGFPQMERVEWLWTELDSMEEMQKTLIDMEDGCTHSTVTAGLDSCRCQWCKSQKAPQPWIDEQTQRVELAFVTFNPHYGMYTYVGTNFVFNRAGHIHKLINVMSAWMNPFAQPPLQLAMLIGSGALWIVCQLYVLFNETKEVVSVIRGATDGVCKALKEDYLSFWNIVDWFSLILSGIIAVLFFAARAAVDVVNGKLAIMMDLSTEAATGTVDRATYQLQTADFFKSVEAMASAEKLFKLGLVIYPTIIMLRLFKSFSAQPRLAIVTKTLQRATEDLIHFSIVFSCVFLCLTVNSILFFGQDLEDFTTLPRAVNSCFRAMFGDWDFEGMSEIGLIKAQVWFWAFMLILVLILLNMLLAVIMDAYTEEKNRTKTAVTMIDQMWSIWRRWRQFKKGERVRLNDIWDAFVQEYEGDVKTMLKDDRMIQISYLTEAVPHLQPTQAKRTLENSLMVHENALEADITEDNRIKHVQDQSAIVEERIGQMMHDVQFLAERAQYYDRLQAPGDPEYDFHFGSEGRSVVEESQEAVSSAISGLSKNICTLFVDNLKQIEGWQDGFERHQNDLHSVVSEMQVMVRQQAWCVAAMTEAVEQLAPGEPDGDDD